MIKNWFKKQPKIGLLPYISEPIYGLKPGDAQIMGWEINDFNIPQAWKNSQGEGVVCAVLDTGCDLNHDDLQENLLDGKNFIDYNTSPNDKNGHGTHVSSTIAALNNHGGMVGVAPKTKIVPVKVLDDNGNGNVKSIVDGIYYASDNKDVNFITMSLGSPTSHPEIEKAINYANRKGKIIFCAAGNSGPNSDIMYPAKYSNTISIGAIDRNLKRTSFSCSGDSLDFLAPGHDIMGCVPNNSYRKMSGTSMSNPFAVGIASLLLSYNLKYKKHRLSNYFDYIHTLKKHTKDLNDSRYASIKKYQGYGILYPVI
jgi:major intracellular serine protease